MEEFIPQMNSLVKYSTPVLVSVAGRNNDIEKQTPKQKRSNSGEKNKPEKMITQEILEKNLPPKEYKLKNGLWLQELRLHSRGARDTGICPIREELYEQCFDELIRQITIDCSQRGLLLVRVRNEFRNQLNKYKLLYESSIAYGMRKMIDAEQKKTDKSNKIMLLDRECQELSKAVEDLEQKISYTKKVESEKLQKDAENHQSEIERIREYNNKLKDELGKLLEGRR